MTRRLIWIPVGIATFALGVAAFLFFQSSPAIDQTIQETVKVLPYTCLPSSRFPGKSRHISSLRVRKSEYFPSGAYTDGWKGRETLMNEWYGKHLYAMDEAPLIKGYEPDSEVYRFLWLRTFHHPITVRVEKTPFGAMLVMKETDGAGGYGVGKITDTRQIELTKEEWCIFSHLIEEANFWNQPLELDGQGGNDGAQWILEGVRENRYNVVDRWSPVDGESAIRDACIYLLQLSRIDIDKLGGDLY